MIIVGFDPGLSRTGFGVVFSDGDRFSFVNGGSLKTHSGELAAKRLHELYEGISDILKRSNPDIVAIEDVFSSVRYPKAGIILGQVTGITMLACHENHVPIVEISAREVKNSLTGYGNATKEQVREVVKKMFKLRSPVSFHMADALALALVVHYRKYLRFSDDILPSWKTKIFK